MIHRINQKIYRHATLLAKYKPFLYNDSIPSFALATVDRLFILKKYSEQFFKQYGMRIQNYRGNITTSNVFLRIALLITKKKKKKSYLNLSPAKKKRLQKLNFILNISFFFSHLQRKKEFYKKEMLKILFSDNKTEQTATFIQKQKLITRLKHKLFYNEFRISQETLVYLQLRLFACLKLKLRKFRRKVLKKKSKKYIYIKKKNKRKIFLSLFNYWFKFNWIFDQLRARGILCFTKITSLLHQKMKPRAMYGQNKRKKPRLDSILQSFVQIIARLWKTVLRRPKINVALTLLDCAPINLAQISLTLPDLTLNINPFLFLRKQFLCVIQEVATQYKTLTQWLQKHQRNQYFKELFNLIFIILHNPFSAQILALFFTRYLVRKNMQARQFHFLTKVKQILHLCFAAKTSLNRFIGVYIRFSGRLNKKKQACKYYISVGHPALNRIRGDVDSASATAFTRNAGTIGIKVSIRQTKF